MRLRLLAILLTLMACALIALDFPLGRALAEREQQRVFSDRLSDVSRFATQAEQAYREDPFGGSGPGEPTRSRSFQSFQDNIRRYDSIYDTQVALVFRGGALSPYNSRPTLDLTGEEIQRHLATAQTGRQSERPTFSWPTNPKPMVLAAPVYQNGDVIATVLLIAPTDRMRAGILREWTLVGMGSLIAIAVFAAGAARLTGWVLKPVRRLDSATHAIALGQYEARVDAAVGPPELRRLASAFNEMVDVVVEAIDQQRAFVANASHQLRNPLGALLLRVEMLGLEAPESLAGDFDEAQQEGQRLTRVLDELLTLARAERMTVSAGVEVDAVEVAEDRVRNWRMTAQRRDIDLILVSPPDVMVLAEQTALSSCLDAVIDNALKFSPLGSTVRVVVRRIPDGEPEMVDIAVIDEGPGLPGEELSRLGDRFWRSASHQNISGSGLGLSIVIALLGPYGGGLHVEQVEPTGLLVALRVPAVTTEMVTIGAATDGLDATDLR